MDGGNRGDGDRGMGDDQSVRAQRIVRVGAHVRVSMGSRVRDVYTIRLQHGMTLTC